MRLKASRKYQWLGLFTMVLLATSVRAQTPPPPHLITLTENSATSLTVQVDAEPAFEATNVGNDSWTFARPRFLPGGTTVWLEPGSERGYNIMTNVDFGPMVSVTSDAMPDVIPLSPPLDSEIVQLGIGAQGEALEARFVDLGDVPAVPEPATVSLLALGLAGIGLARAGARSGRR